MSLRDAIVKALGQAEGGLSENEICQALKLPRHLKGKVHRDLTELLERKLVAKNSRHRYSVVARASAPRRASGQALEGIFTMSGGGSSFIRGADNKDYYVPEHRRQWALPDDRVEFRPLPPQAARRSSGNDGPRKPKPGAEVVRVLARGRQQWVGRYAREERQDLVRVPLGEVELELDVADVPPSVPVGEWIVVGAMGLPAVGGEPSTARFVSHLGGDGAPHLDTLVLIKKAGLREEFEAATLAETMALSGEPPEQAKQGRLDLRDGIVFTIDGADAKDFDDAVSLTRVGKGWRLGVHIADVSHYVRPGSALDNEAYARSTSVYLPDRVLPMLPEALSNGLCSLKPDVDRLALSAIIELDAQGHFVGSSFAESVIRSCRRFTYDEIELWFEGKGQLREGEDLKLGPTLRDMRELALLRRTLRAERGALDFNFPETKVEVDGQGKPTRLYRRDRFFTHQLIEEFMLAANEAVASALRKRDLPLLYRVHEKPDEEKMALTMVQLARLKLGAPRGSALTPKDLQKILARAAGTPNERLVNTLLLRSLRLARYTPGHDMHFGLALADYCHFTSPIRRYPDLVVHRMLRAGILQSKGTDVVKSIAGDLVIVGEHTSTMERRAEACERDCVKAKQARYMMERIGEEYAATVTGVTGFGFFCEIDDFPVEGMVSLSSLPDYYDFDSEQYCLLSAGGKKKIQIGDKVRIKVKSADWETLRVDFVLVSTADLRKRPI